MSFTVQEEKEIVDSALNAIDELRNSVNQLLQDLGNLPGENQELRDRIQQFVDEDVERDAKLQELKDKVAGNVNPPETGDNDQ